MKRHFTLILLFCTLELVSVHAQYSVQTPWEVSLTIQCGKTVNLNFGTRISATDAFDRNMDVLAPPSAPFGADAFFQISGDFNKLSTDFRSNTATPNTWILKITGTDGVSGTVSWNTTNFPSGHNPGSLFINDMNMFTQNTLTFQGDQTYQISFNAPSNNPIRVQLNVNCGSTNTLMFGTQSGGSEGFDANMDTLAPPPPFSGLYSYFKISGFFNKLTSDFRSNLASDHLWTLHVVGTEGASGIISWKTLSLPSEESIETFSINGTNMLNQDSLSFTGDQTFAILFSLKPNPNSYTEENFTIQSGRHPVIASFEQGGFVVTWYENDQFIKGQVFQEISSPNTPFVIEAPYDSYNDIGLATFSDGGFVIGFGSNGRLCNQLFDENEQKIGGLKTVNNMNLSWDDSRPGIATLYNSGFIEFWRGSDNNGFDVFGSFFDRSGVSLKNTFKIDNSYTSSSYYYNAKVANLYDRGFAVCWEVARGTSSAYDIMAAVFHPDGTQKRPAFFVTQEQEYEYKPVIAPLHNGFVVVWRYWPDDPLQDRIYGQCYDFDGNKIGEAFKINTTDLGWQSSPSVAALEDGSFVVCWRSVSVDLTEQIISAQIVSGNGTIIGNEFQVNDLTGEFHDRPCVTGLKNGGFVICWEHQNPSTSLWTVEGKYYHRDIPDGIENDFHIQPRNFEIQNYPNPFNGTTRIRFYIPSNGEIMTTIFDITGQKVYSFKPEKVNPGIIEQIWEGIDEKGGSLSSGIYIINTRLTGINKQIIGKSIKLILTK